MCVAWQAVEIINGDNSSSREIDAERPGPHAPHVVVVVTNVSDRLQ